jgi:nucleoside phosphorylase
MSKLLVFAHHGEAQSFISHFKLKPIDRTTYRNDELHLLICGEGKENALFHTTKYLAQNNIDSVYNFGVVASLRENIQSLQVF